MHCNKTGRTRLVRKMTAGAVACVLGLLGQLVFAHHSAIAFDTTGPHVTVTGTVTQFIWRSPHTSLNMEVINEQGEKELWRWEGGGTVALVRHGVTRDTFVPDLTVTVSGNPMRDGSPGGLMRMIRLEDGRVFDFGASSLE
jgi:hypothetical protein